jgi:SAM-dependent methyltransferase
MVAAYNTRAENQGLTKAEMFAYQGNLCDPGDPKPAALEGPEFSGFDVAAVGMGFHHFDDPQLAAARLVERLKPGGVLLIIDFLTHSPMGHHHHHHHPDAAATVTHHGFSADKMRDIFDKAGAGKDFGLTDLGGITSSHQGHDGSVELKRNVFLARGTKM